MKRIALVAALLGTAMFVLAGVATAGKVSQLKPFEWAQNPSDTRLAVAHRTNEGLSLQKNAPTATWVMAGAEIKGVAGQKLEELSFDVKNGSYCGAGAPRFNVYTATDTLFFGCTYGEHTDLGNGWTHVEFHGDEPGAGAFGGIITGVDVVQDEEGQTLLRNISVNGVVVD